MNEETCRLADEDVAHVLGLLRASRLEHATPINFARRCSVKTHFQRSLMLRLELKLSLLSLLWPSRTQNQQQEK